MVDMSAVTASKLFKTSFRQKEILGKAGLVTSSGALTVQEPQQLDVKVNTEKLEEDNNVKQVSDKPSVSNDSSNKSKERVVVSPRTNVRTGDTDDSTGGDEYKDVDDVKNDVPEKEVTDEKDVTSSTVSASSLPRTDVTDNMNLEVKDIKGTLNSIESTSGVSRVSVKDDKEVWIHYNDNVNLNDVMVDVIEYMNKYGYTYLEFNRLARSENAVVFVIIKSDTAREKKPTVDSEE